LRRISQAPLTEQERYLLGECVETYLPLDETKWGEFNRLLTTKPYEEVKKMRVSSYALAREEARKEARKESLEEGRREGREEGHRELLRELLEQRFGPLSKRLQGRVQALSTEQLRELFKQGLRAKSLSELGLGEGT